MDAVVVTVVLELEPTARAIGGRKFRSMAALSTSSFFPPPLRLLGSTGEKNTFVRVSSIRLIATR